jgi:hypothetical protein
LESSGGDVNGTTPRELIDRGIYSEIAVPLKAEPFRRISLGMLSQALADEDPETQQEEAAPKDPPSWTINSQYRATRELAHSLTSPCAAARWRAPTWGDAPSTMGAS